MCVAEAGAPVSPGRGRAVLQSLARPVPVSGTQRTCVCGLVLSCDHKRESHLARARFDLIFFRSSVLPIILSLTSIMKANRIHSLRHAASCG